MAILDVIEALSDPFFLDSATVVRSTRTVGANGRVTVTEARTTIYAVVQPGSGAVTDMLPEAERALDSIEVYAQFALAAASTDTTADDIEWRGKRWRVSKVMDWTNFGSGYSHAICVLKSTALPVNA